jgi:hypothetical protein
MSIQRKVTPEGKVRYRARIKANGREVASRMFDRKSDAVAWEQDQRRRLRAGEWLDPRRGQVPLSVVAEMWLESRHTVKRRTLESDHGAWRNYIAPRFGRRPVASITTADVSSWLGDLMRRGLARSTATRALATLRSLLSFAVADGRVTVNAAAAAKTPTGGSRGARVASSSSMKWWLWPKRAEALMRSWSTYSRCKAFGGVSWPACRWVTG